MIRRVISREAKGPSTQKRIGKWVNLIRNLSCGSFFPVLNSLNADGKIENS